MVKPHFWFDNWILDGAPRPPMVHPEIIDLTLKVSDLINNQTGQWDEALIRQIVEANDVDLVLNTKVSARLQDKHIWGLYKNGVYSSQSGYRFLISLLDFQPVQTASLPPIEKNLWTSIWKIKTLPKIIHFFWKALAGALAVAKRLQTRGIHVLPRAFSLLDSSGSVEEIRHSTASLRSLSQLCISEHSLSSFMHQEQAYCDKLKLPCPMANL